MGAMKLKRACCDVRDLSGDEVRSLPLVGRVGQAADDAQHRLEAEAGVVETSEARSQVHTRGLVVAHPHPTGLRPATLPTMRCYAALGGGIRKRCGDRVLHMR
jgi:hypothetical protein